jgi:DNA replication protein DnaC
MENILPELLRAEKAERHMRSIRYRLGIAKFAVVKDLEGFDFPSSAVNEDRIRTLCQGGFVEARMNVVFVGGTGTGKTHLSGAIGIHVSAAWPGSASSSCGIWSTSSNRKRRTPRPDGWPRPLPALA